MESTLSLKFSDLCGEVGLFLGYGRGATFNDPAWSSQQQAAIESCVKSGLRKFYFPPPVDQSGSSYDWSFLRPVVSVTLASGASTVTLPDDFGGFEGEISLTSGSQSFAAVELTGEGRIRQLFSATPSATGRPLLAALQPIKGTTIDAGQRERLYVYPTADAAYTLTFAYYILADCLSGTRPYAYGGMAHAETILESCLSVAEQRLDDSQSVHTVEFLSRLTASISLDRRLKPQKLGYNADRSDGMIGLDRRYLHTQSTITVKGIQY